VNGSNAGREGRSGLESAVPVAEQHAHVVADEVGRDQVRDGVGVEAPTKMDSSLQPGTGGRRAMRSSGSAHSGLNTGRRLRRGRLETGTRASPKGPGGCGYVTARGAGPGRSVE